MTYCIPYLLLLFYFAFGAYYYEHSKSEISKSNTVLLSIFVFYIFFAFRGYVYTDWTSYSAMLKDLTFDDIFNITNKNQKAVFHEPGFTLLCVICKTITTEYAFLVIIITTIDTILFLRFLRQWHIENIPFVFMLFMTFEGIGIMFNLLRNQISIFIFLNALIYIKERKAKKYFLLCTLAICFHISSIFFFPLYFFLHKTLNKNIFLILAIVFLIFYIGRISIVMSIIKILGLGGTIGEKAEFYTEVLDTSRQFSPTGTLEKIGITIIVYLYYDNLITKLDGRQIFINSLLLYLFFYCVFSEFQDLSARLADLFIFSYWILWGDVIKLLYIKNNKILLSCIIVLYCSYVNIRAYNEPIQQYDNLLFGAKSQEERLKILDRTVDPN